MLDAERRREMILADAKNLAFAQGYELVEDQALLEEVAGLVETSVVTGVVPEVAEGLDQDTPTHE